VQNSTQETNHYHWGLIVSVLFATFFLWLQSRYCNLHPGRDMATYWSYYQDFFKIHPESRTLMLFRGPVTPLFFGIIFDFFGTTGVQVVLAILYVLCLVTVWVIGARLSVWVGFLALILLGGDIQFYYWFFSVGSESPQSFLLLLWMAYAVFTFRKRKPQYWVLHAVVVWLLILNRAGNQVFILCAFFSLFNVDIVWKRRMGLLLVFLISYGFCHILFASYNYARLGAFQVSTMGNAVMPFYRLYLQDDLISPDNGKKSAELAGLVEKNILTLDDFDTYHIDRDMFFKHSSQRMYNYLVITVADVYGWDDQWLILRQASLEALFKHPLDFFLTYIDHLRDVFYVRGDGRYDFNRHSRSKAYQDNFLKQRYKLYEKLGLSIPTEGDLLPKPRVKGVKNVEGNYTALTFFNAKNPPVVWIFPDRHCSYHWGDVFDIYGVKFPFTFFFICIGGCGVVLSVMRGETAVYISMVCVASVSFVNLAATLMGSVEFPFRYPFDSIFILFGCFGLHAMWSYWKIQGGRSAESRRARKMKKLLHSTD